MSYERITCEDVRVGDRIGRTRNDDFPEVTAIDEGPVSRRIYFGFGSDTFRVGNIRPRRTARLWRLA